MTETIMIIALIVCGLTCFALGYRAGRDGADWRELPY
jgi:hypothetical protein